ncbi:MAG TPA: DMT family transporter [Burkholderiaceae bacterium]|nr:DMT family transporter [Burkholderiaceae bacterium]
MSPPSEGARERDRVLAGIGLAVCASASFAVLDTTVKYLAQTYPTPLVAWARYAFHVLLMALLWVPRRGAGLVSTRAPALQVARGLCLGMSAMAFFSALAVLPQAEATALVSTSPILVTALAVLWLRERAPRGTAWALLSSFAGVLLIVRPGGALFGPQAVLPLVAAVFAAGYALLTRRLAGVDDGVSTLFIGALVATVLLTGLVPMYWTPPVAAWHVALAAFAGLVGAIGHLMLVRAYERADASTLAPYAYAQVVAAIGLGWAVFGTFPDVLALAGMGLIVATGVAMTLARR